MRQRPFPGPFPLAKDNALIVGNAAGLNIPITGEGINTAIKSALMAADAVIKASDKGEKAADFYLSTCQDMLSTLESMYSPLGRLREEVRKGTGHFLEAIKEVYSSSMRIR
jgi:flavin-dependent dehydrogenase